MISTQLQRTHRPSKLIASFGLAVCLSVSLVADLAWACRENAMIVFDASASMAQPPIGIAKIELARIAVADVLPDITKYRPTGLVTFGGNKAASCGAIAVRVDPVESSAAQIVATLKKIQPFGGTPLTGGVRAAADVLQHLAAPGIVVLITDGVENCGGNVCGLAHQLQDHSNRLRIHVIGLFLDGRGARSPRCLADATNGAYVSVDSLNGLRHALRALLSCPRIW